MKLILFGKPGCHLCEGLQEKLEQVSSIPLQIDIRDITTRDDWFQAYQYEIPVLVWEKETEDAAIAYIPLPRLSPRASVNQVEQMLQKYWAENSQQ
ncbi:MAG: glutaredoxin family protein [Synechococcales cyanobacterium T60_A2020_003]|nr:glutaredoxin family protein [Synechococcales cyanobacterium T60_A2020_003]